MDKISIIVPFHSLENYLETCLTSIKNQTYKNFEVIMLANNVKDNSKKIAEKFAKEDKRFLLFDFPLQSKNIALIRNYALKLATGKYLTWVDGDDFVSPNYLMAQYLTLTQNCAQLAICKVKPSHSQIVHFAKKLNFAKLTKSSLDSQQLQIAILNDDNIHGGLMNKLFVTKLAQKIEFDKYCSMYEDLDYNLKYAKLCQKAVYSGKKLYGYFLRPGSLTKTKTQLSILRRVNTLNKLVKDGFVSDYAIFARGVHSAITLHLIKKCKKSSYEKKVKIVLANYLKQAYKSQKKLKVVFYKKLFVWLFYMSHKKYLKYKLFENK